jgi:hypothetical protein
LAQPFAGLRAAALADKYGRRLFCHRGVTKDTSRRPFDRRMLGET